MSDVLVAGSLLYVAIVFVWSTIYKREHGADPQFRKTNIGLVLIGGSVIMGVGAQIGELWAIGAGGALCGFVLRSGLFYWQNDWESFDHHPDALDPADLDR